MPPSTAFSCVQIALCELCPLWYVTFQLDLRVVAEQGDSPPSSAHQEPSCPRKHKPRQVAAVPHEDLQPTAFVLVKFGQRRED